MHLIAKSFPSMHALVWQPEEKQIFPVGGNHMLLCNSRDKDSTPLSQPALFNSLSSILTSEKFPGMNWLQTLLYPALYLRAWSWNRERLLRRISAQFDGSREWLFKWAVVPGLSGMSIKHMTEISILSWIPFSRSVIKRQAFFLYISKSHSKSFCETCL